MEKLQSLLLSPNDYVCDEHQILINKLNYASIDKFYNAYLDIPWDDPDYSITRGDLRWELPDYDPLGGTAWYKEQPDDVRANLSLDRSVHRVKLGIIFENILIRGMMAFSATLPNNSQEFRYSLHECAEETQHSLMFQEFINRSGSNPPNLKFPISLFAQYIIRCGDRFPELFFIFVLGGEEPIDFEQRKQLRCHEGLHPLMQTMNRIHITEEARHIAFARAYLNQAVPKLSWWKTLKLKLLTPLILGTMGKLFLAPPASIIRQYGIPADVIKKTYQSKERTEELRLAMKSTIGLCQSLGLLNKSTCFLWRFFSLAV